MFCFVLWIFRRSNSLAYANVSVIYHLVDDFGTFFAIILLTFLLINKPFTGSFLGGRDMSFVLGLSVGSVLGFIVACFCSISAWGVSTETVSSEAIEEVALSGADIAQSRFRSMAADQPQEPGII